MGGNYEKNIYKQLMEIMERCDSLENDLKSVKTSSKSQINSLNKDVEHLTSKCNTLEEENVALLQKVDVLTNENTSIRKQNELLKAENFHLKRKQTNTMQDSLLAKNPVAKKGILEPRFQKNGRRENPDRQFETYS